MGRSFREEGSLRESSGRGEKSRNESGWDAIFFCSSGGYYFDQNKGDLGG